MFFRARVARARLQRPGKISEMELRRLPKIVEPGVRAPSWRVHVEGVGEDAEISATPTRIESGCWLLIADG